VPEARKGVHAPPIYRDHRNPFLKAGWTFRANGIQAPPGQHAGRPPDDTPAPAKAPAGGR